MTPEMQEQKKQKKKFLSLQVTRCQKLSERGHAAGSQFDMLQNKMKGQWSSWAAGDELERFKALKENVDRHFNRDSYWQDIFFGVETKDLVKVTSNICK